MKTKFNRITVVILGIILGIALIYALSFMGSMSKGPLEDTMVKIGSGITDLDKKFMSKSTRKKRSKKLSWLNPALKKKEELFLLEKPLIGAFDNESLTDFESIINLESQLETDFSLIHIYTAWGSKPEQRFPLTRVKAILELGSIPVLTWEPWLTDFDEKIHTQLRPKEMRDKGGLKDISSGNYDFYLDTWIEDLQEIDRTIIIRLGHEMNDPYRYVWGPQNNAPEDFVEAWKYVVQYFRTKGVNNVLWNWSPHIAYGYFDAYYPGSNFVDIIGVGALNYGEVAVWSEWWTFDQIFGNYYKDLARFSKPIMLTEFGCLAVGGDRKVWYEEAICTLSDKYPLINSLIFFHYSNDRTLTDKSLDWTINDDPEIIQAAKACLKIWQVQRTSAE